MFIASLNNQDINADAFVEMFGSNYQQHTVKAHCLICDEEVTLKNGLSDISNCFTHKPHSNCPIVTINRRDIPHINKFKKNDNENVGLRLRQEIAENQNILVNIYIRTHELAGSKNMGIWQFCQLLLLSIERDIWNLKEASITTIPYLLVQLDDFPIKVKQYEVEKTKDNQFKFVLMRKTKKDRRNIFTNYYLRKIPLNRDESNEKEWIRNIPTPAVEQAKNWLKEKEDIMKLLVERANNILVK